MVVSPRLRELVKATAKKLNRSWADAEPFLALLSENWYDTVDSLKIVQVTDLQALGIPQRFSKELLQLAESDNVPESPYQPSQPPEKHGGHEKQEWKGKAWGEKSGRKEAWNESWKESWKEGQDWKAGKDWKEGKGKGKGKTKNAWAQEKHSGWSGWKDWKDTSKEKWNWKEKWSQGYNKEDEGWERRERWQDHQRVLPSHREFALAHKITFDESLDPAFPLAAKLIGKGGCNVKRICNATNAWVWLAGQGSGLKEENGFEADEPIHVLVKSDDQASLDEAVAATNGLIDWVLEQYMEWLERGGAAGDVKGKGKAKGGEKRSWQGQENSQKWARR